MITCNLMGGLGNQLFQIFTVIAYSIQYKVPFYFLRQSTLGGGNTTLRYTYWNSFLSKLTAFLQDNYREKVVLFKENGFLYQVPLSPSKLNTSEIVFYGYFQSPRYFEHYFSYIYRFLDISNQKQKVLDKLHLTNLQLKNSISMHFRYGDYKNVSEFHPLLKHTYYSNAIDYLYNNIMFEEQPIVYTFYDEKEKEDKNEIEGMIHILKMKYPNLLFKHIDGLEDYEEMLFMSSCNHNIIANSSFSWWAAYLNNTPNKVICYPSVWFGSIANNDTRDLFPTDWHKIQV